MPEVLYVPTFNNLSHFLFTFSIIQALMENTSANNTEV